MLPCVPTTAHAALGILLLSVPPDVARARVHARVAGSAMARPGLYVDADTAARAAAGFTEWAAWERQCTQEICALHDPARVLQLAQDAAARALQAEPCTTWTAPPDPALLQDTHPSHESTPSVRAVIDAQLRGWVARIGPHIPALGAVLGLPAREVGQAAAAAKAACLAAAPHMSPGSAHIAAIMRVGFAQQLASQCSGATACPEQQQLDACLHAIDQALSITGS